MNKINAVIFDMDGLMFDTEKVYYEVNQDVAKELEMDYTFETYTSFVGSGFKQEHAGMIELFEDEQLVATFFEKSGKILNVAFREEPIDIMPGLFELLEYLREEDIPAVVASSTRRELVDHMTRRLGVHDYFADFVGGDEVPFAKPDPAIFNKAFGKTGLTNKQEVIVLEDSKNGILAAHAADIPVILVPNMVEPDDEMTEKSEAILPDLFRVKEFIKEKNQ